MILFFVYRYRIKLDSGIDIRYRNPSVRAVEQRIGPGVFEGLPDKRKIMVLRQLRSLVVAYDHLSDDRRKELTTALEIIKNREVLNRVRCIFFESSSTPIFQKKKKMEKSTVEHAHCRSHDKQSNVAIAAIKSQFSRQNPRIRTNTPHYLSQTTKTTDCSLIGSRFLIPWYCISFPLYAVPLHHQLVGLNNPSI